jgi:Ni,Fe-hydrogenase III large subunit
MDSLIFAAAERSPSAFYDEVLNESHHAPILGAYAEAGYAHYLFLGASGPYARSYHFDGPCRLRALSAARPLLMWDEREMERDWPIEFDGIPRTTVPDGEGLMHFVVGPVHAGIIECGRFTFTSAGENVVHLDAQLGFGHRGVERQLEGLSALEAAPKVARICGGCSAARSFAFVRAVEQLAGYMPDEPIELARLIVAELERLYNHVHDVAAAASAAGYAVGFARGMALKERIMRLCALACGHRLLFDAIPPGGAVLTNRTKLASELNTLRSDLERFLANLFGNASLVSRWQRAGLLTPAVAEACGAVGPAARGSAGTIDVRAFAPYGAYASLTPSIARATSGDVFARVAVKRDEMLESLRLLKVALNALGATPLPEPGVIHPRDGIAYGVVEGPRGCEVVALRVRAGRIARLHVISSSFRNWPVVVRAMEDTIVPDFPLVNKSFNLCYACADR